MGDIAFAGAAHEFQNINLELIAICNHISSQLINLEKINDFCFY